MSRDVIERLGDLEKRYVLDVIDKGFSTTNNSIYNNLLEKKFAQVIGCDYAIGHVNGTATMHTALYALGVRPGDEVIVPPLTMSSTSLAVLHNGSIPVYADVEKDTFNIDPQSVEKVITERTRAIITVSLYGLPPDYDKLLEICRKYNLYLSF